jgi:hypothetical protein
MKKYILVILCLFCIGWTYDGGWDSGTSRFRAIVYPVERATTNDTITAADVGRTFSIDCEDGKECTFILPEAYPGMSFTFIQEATAETIYIDTGVTTDTIRYLTMSAGDKLKNSGTTGDSIELISTQRNYWNIKNIYGSWTDAN